MYCNTWYDIKLTSQRDYKSAADVILGAVQAYSQQFTANILLTIMARPTDLPMRQGTNLEFIALCVCHTVLHVCTVLLHPLFDIAFVFNYWKGFSKVTLLVLVTFFVLRQHGVSIARVRLLTTILKFTFHCLLLFNEVFFNTIMSLKLGPYQCKL